MLELKGIGTVLVLLSGSAVGIFSALMRRHTMSTSEESGSQPADDVVDDTAKQAETTLILFEET